MRLIRYINEANADISYYINFHKSNPGIIFWRGMGYGSYVDFEKVYDVSKNRRPQATKLSLYKLINKWLEAHDFCRRDRSVFCKVKNGQLDGFGRKYPIIPIGRFKYTYVKADDFNYVTKGDIFDIVFFYWLYVDEFPELFSIKGQYLNKITDKDFRSYVDKFYDDKTIIKFKGIEVYTKGVLDKGVKNLKNMFSNKNIKEAYYNDWEVWIECDKYLVFENEDTYNAYIGE